MDIETKCSIIEEFMREHVLNELFEGDEIDKFISYNDLGIPLAQSVAYELATLTAEGKNLVEETWESLCAMFEIDHEGEYEDLDDLFDEAEKEE
jgi:hypothetical protein